MVSFEEIEASLASHSVDDTSAVASFREIQGVLKLYRYPIDQLGFLLEAIEAILPIVEGFDQENAGVWSRWASTISQVCRNLDSSLITAPRSRTFSLTDSFAKQFTFACCLTANSKKTISSRLPPAKALLLIAHYRFYQKINAQKLILYKYHNSYEHTSSKQILSCLISQSSVYDEHAEQMLPPWPNSSFARWRELFLENSKDLPRDESYKDHYGYKPDHFVFLRTLRRVLGVSTSGETNSRPREQENAPPEGQRNNQEICTSVITHPPTEHKTFSPRNERPRLPSFTYFRKPSPDADSNSEGLAPTVIHATPQTETPSEQPEPPPTVQSLGVRYSNYRTGMNNQRLPWQWDCLNKFEIKAVRAALTASSEKLEATPSEKHGAFIVWLLLTTGQTIEEILHFGLGRSQGNRSAIVAGPIYLRNINSPLHSFSPKSEQQIYLKGHSSTVAFPLPGPFPTLATELGLTDSNISLIKDPSTIGACLNLNIEQAETAARLFLENYRTRSFRLLPGRIRNVLSNEVMQATSDPVATHLLSALPTDTPPSGVYYTSYSQERLECIYAAAMAKVLGGVA